MHRVSVLPLVKVNMRYRVDKNKTHIPKNSLFFEKVIPALLIFMGLITFSMVLFAAGILVGLIHF